MIRPYPNPLEFTFTSFKVQGLALRENEQQSTNLTKYQSKRISPNSFQYKMRTRRCKRIKSRLAEESSPSKIEGASHQHTFSNCHFIEEKQWEKKYTDIQKRKPHKKSQIKRASNQVKCDSMSNYE